MDTHQVPGTISREQVLLLDGCTTPLDTANRTISLHATTTPPEDINHAVLPNQHQNANKPAQMVLPTRKTNGSLIQSMESHQALKESKLKS